MKTTTQTVTDVISNWKDDEVLRWLLDGWTITITKGGKSLTRVKTIVIPTI